MMRFWKIHSFTAFRRVIQKFGKLWKMKGAAYPNSPKP